MSNIRFIEVVVRIIVVVACAGALIAASISIDKFLDIKNNDILSPFITDNIRQRTEATAALAIVSGVIIPLEILMIVLHLFKISLGAFGRIIIAVDLLLLLLAACGFGVAGVLGAVTAKDWSDDYVDYVDKLPSFLDPFTGDIRDIRNDIAATAACSLFACGSCAGLLIFIIVLLVRYNKFDYTGL